MNRRRISAGIISHFTSIGYGASRGWRLFCARSPHPPPFNLLKSLVFPFWKASDFLSHFFPTQRRPGIDFPNVFGFDSEIPFKRLVSLMHCAKLDLLGGEMLPVPRLASGGD
jgi:hypothetical protein